MEENIKKITIVEGNQASFCPMRGGIITSIKLKGKEILYLDEDTFKNSEVNVRGGIPILFPNAGPLENSTEFPNLKQHGFARNSDKWQSELNNNYFKEVLISDDDTLKLYPYNFQLSIEGILEKNGSFTLIQKVLNKEINKDIPVSMGLHPYFKVSNDHKKNIKFNFEGGEYIEDNIDMWSNGKFISIDNPSVLNSTSIMEISIPSLGMLEIKASPEYKKIWIWSLPDKDFICIEPVMRDNGGLVDNPEMIKPNEILSAQININLK
ncbi:MAG: hypothetical protein KGI58_01710 [Patescibacteria group bacterium]|nr:hypothetical protein [Patescibacteria group bacterium]